MTTVTPFRFAELLPDPRLRPWVRTYWEFTVGEGAPAAHHVPPDGCTSILLAGAWGASPTLVCSGPWTTPLVLPSAPGQRHPGVRLAPGAAPALLGVPAQALVNRAMPVPATAILPVAQLTASLAAGDLAAFAAATDAVLLAAAETLPLPDPLATSALQLIWDGKGRVSLEEVAVRTGCSPRTLLRRVRAATGLTPKQYARVVRFNITARGMLDPDARLSHVAAHGGYADQPHFHHEVAALTGLTPAALAAQVRRTHHRLRS